MPTAKRKTRRKTKIGGAVFQAPKSKYMPGISFLQNNNQKKLFESTQQPLEQPIQKPLEEPIQKPLEEQPPEQIPIQPFRILVKGDPEFKVAVALAPKLKNLRSVLSNYNINYLKKALRSFSYSDSHQAYTTEKKENTCFVYVVPKLITILKKEIDNIQNKSESLGYAFASDSADKVIAEINNYIRYIEKNNTGWDRINSDFITAIFE